MIFSNDGTLYSFSKKRLNHLFEAYSASSENYSQAYVTWISPLDFLSLTVSDVQGFLEKNKDKVLDYKKLCEERQEIFLTVDFDSGEVVGHEGRHRMAALHNAGAEQVAIAVRAYGEKGKYERKFIPEIIVTGQEFWMCRPVTKADGIVQLRGLLPVSRAYRDTVRNVFGPDAALITYFGERVGIGEVRGFSDNPSVMKPLAECKDGMSTYVHLHDEKNPEALRDYAIPVEEFMDWVQIDKHRIEARRIMGSLDDAIDAAAALGKNQVSDKVARAFVRDLEGTR